MTPDRNDHNEHAGLRMRYANLLAAARATLTAARDGDPAALAYLADELAAHGQHPPTSAGAPVIDAEGLAAWFDITFDSTRGMGDERGHR